MSTVEAKDYPHQFHGISAPHGEIKFPQDRKLYQLVSEHSVLFPKDHVK